MRCGQRYHQVSERETPFNYLSNNNNSSTCTTETGEGPSKDYDIGCRMGGGEGRANRRLILNDCVFLARMTETDKFML